MLIIDEFQRPTILKLINLIADLGAYRMKREPYQIDNESYYEDEEEIDLTPDNNFMNTESHFGGQQKTNQFQPINNGYNGYGQQGGTGFIPGTQNAFNSGFRNPQQNLGPSYRMGSLRHPNNQFSHL